MNDYENIMPKNLKILFNFLLPSIFLKILLSNNIA